MYSEQPCSLCFFNCVTSAGGACERVKGGNLFMCPSHGSRLAEAACYHKSGHGPSKQTPDDMRKVWWNPLCVASHKFSCTAAKNPAAGLDQSMHGLISAQPTGAGRTRAFNPQRAAMAPSQTLYSNLPVVSPAGAVLYADPSAACSWQTTHTLSAGIQPCKTCDISTPKLRQSY